MVSDNSYKGLYILKLLTVKLFDHCIIAARKNKQTKKKKKKKKENNKKTTNEQNKQAFQNHKSI